MKFELLSVCIILLTIAVAKAEVCDYDENQNQLIDKIEVVKAISEYFDGNITKDELNEVIKYWKSKEKVCLKSEPEEKPKEVIEQFSPQVHEISKSEVKKILKEYGISTTFNYYYSSRKLTYTDYESWKKILSEDSTDRRPYQLGYYVCLHFASEFAENITEKYGLSVGVAFGYINNMGHVFNIVLVREDDKIVPYIYEPQKDVCFSKLTPKKGYINSVGGYKGILRMDFCGAEYKVKKVRFH
jgi:hypothetical protein